MYTASGLEMQLAYHLNKETVFSFQVTLELLLGVYPANKLQKTEYLNEMVMCVIRDGSICLFVRSAKQLVRGEPNVSYICSRYYRAPELIFGATDYTSSIGTWALIVLPCKSFLLQ